MKYIDRYVIPVVWGLDSKYVLQAFVVMRAILENSSQEYKFFLLTADNIKNKVKEYTSVLQKKYSHFEVFVRKIDASIFSNARIYNKHLSKAAYFRLLISEIIMEYDKCIYLDCDLIVYGDLKEVFEIELEDNYLAGIKDCHIAEDTPYQHEHQKIIGLPSRDKYVNSGVLLLNLKKIRKNHLINSFMKQLEKENWYEDQDVLNRCCYPFIKLLPLKYNLFHFYLGKNIKHLYKLPYSEEDFDFDHPFILHMGSIYKPWNSYAIKGSSEWWQLAEIFHECQEYQYCKQKCQEEASHNEIQELIRKAEKSRQVVIWGYTSNGKQLCDIFLEYQLNNITAIADNNENLWGIEYHGIPVQGLSSIKDKMDDILWIITCRKAYEEVARQLKSCGIKDADMFHYVNRHEERMYLLSLQESAYEKEIGYIADIEYVSQIPDADKRKQYINRIIKYPDEYSEEYEYLSKKYLFQYWIGTPD